MQSPFFSNALTDDEFVLLREIVFWDLEVQWGWASSHTSRNVVVGTVTWAEPSSVITRLADGNAS